MRHESFMLEVAFGGHLQYRHKSLAIVEGLMVFSSRTGFDGPVSGP